MSRKLHRKQADKYKALSDEERAKVRGLGLGREIIGRGGKSYVYTSLRPTDGHNKHTPPTHPTTNRSRPGSSRGTRNGRRACRPSTKSTPPSSPPSPTLPKPHPP